MVYLFYLRVNWRLLVQWPDLPQLHNKQHGRRFMVNFFLKEFFFWKNVNDCFKCFLTVTHDSIY